MRQVSSFLPMSFAENQAAILRKSKPIEQPFCLGCCACWTILVFGSETKCISDEFCKESNEDIGYFERPAAAQLKL